MLYRSFRAPSDSTWLKTTLASYLPESLSWLSFAVFDRDIVHAGVLRAHPTATNQFVNGVLFTHRQDFNPAVREVADPSIEAERVGGMFGPGTIKDALDPATDQKPAALHGAGLRIRS